MHEELRRLDEIELKKEKAVRAKKLKNKAVLHE